MDCQIDGICYNKYITTENQQGIINDVIDVKRGVYLYRT